METGWAKAAEHINHAVGDESAVLEGKQIMHSSRKLAGLMQNRVALTRTLNLGDHQVWA